MLTASPYALGSAADHAGTLGERARSPSAGPETLASGKAAAKPPRTQPGDRSHERKCTEDPFPRHCTLNTRVHLQGAPQRPADVEGNRPHLRALSGATRCWTGRWLWEPGASDTCRETLPSSHGYLLRLRWSRNREEHTAAAAGDGFEADWPPAKRETSGCGFWLTEMALATGEGRDATGPRGERGRRARCR